MTADLSGSLRTQEASCVPTEQAVKAVLVLKPGDWVLVDHPFFADSFVVREVKSVTKAMFVGKSARARPGEDDGERVEASRSLKAVRGVFASQADALACADAIMPLFNAKMEEEKAARARFAAAVLAFLTPTTPASDSAVGTDGPHSGTGVRP